MLALRHLRILSVVVREGGIRSSSESLLRAASAVSRSIGLLERELDAQLFERKAGGMLLTRTGELVHARFERIEQELGIVLQEAVAARDRRRDDAFTAAAVDALFDERRLLAISLLAELHQMRAVGRQLGTTQPAISAVLARVEGALGHKLFLRTARGMMPTDAGARWVIRFDRALAELRYLDADVAAAKGSLEGVITVGTLPLARTQMLPVAVSALQAEHPGLRIHSLESPYEQLSAGLLSGKVDFIVGALRPQVDKGLTCEPLFADELGLIAAATHPLAARKRLRLEDLRPYRWVLSRPDTPLRGALSRFFASHGEPAPVPAVETGDQALVRGLLLQGPMLTVLSTRQLRYEIDAGHLCVLALPMEGMQRQIGLTTRTGASLSAAALSLMQQIRTSARNS